MLCGPFLPSFSDQQPRKEDPVSTTATARRNHRTATEVARFMSFELGEQEWKIAWATSLGERPRCRTLRARDTKRLLAGIRKGRDAANARPGVPGHEAGR